MGYEASGERVEGVDDQAGVLLPDLQATQPEYGEYPAINTVTELQEHTGDDAIVELHGFKMPLGMAIKMGEKCLQAMNPDDQVHYLLGAMKNAGSLPSELSVAYEAREKRIQEAKRAVESVHESQSDKPEPVKREPLPTEQFIVRDLPSESPGLQSAAPLEQSIEPIIPAMPIAEEHAIAYEELLNEGTYELPQASVIHDLMLDDDESQKITTEAVDQVSLAASLPTVVPRSIETQIVLPTLELGQIVQAAPAGSSLDKHEVSYGFALGSEVPVAIPEVSIEDIIDQMDQSDDYAEYQPFDETDSVNIETFLPVPIDITHEPSNQAEVAAVIGVSELPSVADFRASLFEPIPEALPIPRTETEQTAVASVESFLENISTDHEGEHVAMEQIVAQIQHELAAATEHFVADAEAIEDYVVQIELLCAQALDIKGITYPKEQLHELAQNLLAVYIRSHVKESEVIEKLGTHEHKFFKKLMPPVLFSQDTATQPLLGRLALVHLPHLKILATDNTLNLNNFLISTCYRGYITLRSQHVLRNSA